MADPPPRVPPDPDETVVVPATEETVVQDDWGPESEVVVEEEQVVPRRRMPVIWPGLLALLLVVLAGLGAYYLASRDDDDAAAPIATTTAAPRDTSVDELRVPDVVGQPFEEAGEDLKAIGLTAVRKDAFGEAEEGIVLRQDPAGGATLREGGQVTLTVSKGLEPVSVPDVVGTTSSEATATMREAGFEVNIVAVPSTEPAGTVLAQNPAAGTNAAKGTTVRLNVAQAAGDTTPAATTAPTTTTAPSQQQDTMVPDVVGQELADAARAFADAGLKIAVQYVPNSEPQGRVVAQAQAPGTKRKRGDTVQLNVSTGPEPAPETSVPDVVGQRQQAARQSLERAGFEVLAIEQAGNPTRVGFVLSQTPSGGAGIPRGSLVILYVGAR